MDRDSGFVGRLEVVDMGRRRRWSLDEKIRIVEESLTGHRQASATARRHGIPNGLLFRWRKVYREGCLSGVAEAAHFVPAVVQPEETAPALASAGGGRMEIALASGHKVTVGTDVDVVALGRVLDPAMGRISSIGSGGDCRGGAGPGSRLLRELRCQCGEVGAHPGGVDMSMERIRELNDAFRTSFVDGRVVMTAGESAVPTDVHATALR